jgi:hypothetical protein
MASGGTSGQPSGHCSFLHGAGLGEPTTPLLLPPHGALFESGEQVGGVLLSVDAMSPKMVKDRSSPQEVGPSKPSSRSDLPRLELPPSQVQLKFGEQVGRVASTQSAAPTHGAAQSMAAAPPEVMGLAPLIVDGSREHPMGAQQCLVRPTTA